MSFTAQLGTADSYLGNIVLGYGATGIPWHPTTNKFCPALPEEIGWHQFRKTTLGYLDGLPTVPNPWNPHPIWQNIDLNQPGYQEPFAHHMRKDFPKALLFGLPVVPPSQADLYPVRNLPLIARDPSVPRVLGRFTDYVSSVLNSLARKGQLIQLGPTDYSIQGTPAILQLTPGPQPETSPYYGILWVDNSGALHYLAPSGEDITIGESVAPTPTPAVSTKFPIVCRVVEDETLTIPDTYSLLVARYFTVLGTGSLVLEGDAVLGIAEIL